MGDLVFVENNRLVTDSLTVAEVFRKEHTRVMRDIRELGCSEEFRLGNFAESYYVNHQGRKMPRVILSEQGLMLLVMGYTGDRAMELKERYIAEFERMKKALQQRNTPQSSAEMLLMMAQHLLEQEKRMEKVEAQLEISNHRIDKMDHIDVNGDEQQQLNKLIRRYARDNGISFQKAWREFTDRFNTAFGTNLTLRMENYQRKHGLRELTRPQYLAEVGQLADAIRVADKMLNHRLIGVS